MIKAVAAVLFTALAGPAVGCETLGEVLFSCAIGEHADEGSISLCQAEDETGGLAGVQLVLEAGATQVTFPPDPREGTALFGFSNTDGGDGYLVDVRFADGDTLYRLYSLYIAPDPTVEDDAGGGVAGLVITGPDGRLTNYACGERPYMFISYMRDAMQCDASNPLGEAACNPDGVPERRLPLGEEAGAPLVIE